MMMKRLTNKKTINLNHLISEGKLAPTRKPTKKKGEASDTKW